MPLDPTLQGVLIGSGLSLLGNLATQWLTSRREEKILEQKHAAEAEAWQRTTARVEQEHLRTLYQDAIAGVMAYLAERSKVQHEGNAKADEKIVAAKAAAMRPLGGVLVRNAGRNSRLADEIDTFSRHWDLYQATGLLELVMELASQEENIFLDALPARQPVKKELMAPGELEFIFAIDKAFRRQQLIEGKQISEQQRITCRFDLLTNGQRECLCMTHFDEGNPIRGEMHLFIPRLLKKEKKVHFRSEHWYAKLNPAEKSASQILQAWEDDFRATLAALESKIATDGQPDPTALAEPSE